ncbi:unnamed protein product [Haemonchus placei]|uniref:Uncharacterized protein n=1 Tax=Haemonchus placei TaxID=6290 RepID=A0A3P7ZTE6_HAEPC|nr:unnamed protein product [Haemonchus placei]
MYPPSIHDIPPETTFQNRLYHINETAPGLSKICSVSTKKMTYPMIYRQVCVSVYLTPQKGHPTLVSRRAPVRVSFQ